MGIQLRIKNFRCLRNVNWSPDGVCVVVGPNGSGKTTLLEALDFLRIAFETTLSQAIATSRSGAYFRNVDATEDEGVSFGLTRFSYVWDLDVVTTGPSIGVFGERLAAGSENLFTASPATAFFSFDGQTIERSENLCIRTLTDMRIDRGKQAVAIVDILRTYRLYGDYRLHNLRETGSPQSNDVHLSPNGMNAFTVLRNWRDKRDFLPAYQFVVKYLRNAFPGVFDELGFEFAGNVTSLSLFDSRRVESLPVTLAPNGLLTGLLHLMAVAGAAYGSIVAIDEFENSLHPFAIRHLVRSMREWAATQALTVVLTGHSPALLDEFREYPSQVFVMEPEKTGQRSLPLRLTDYRDPEWLKHFSLGELYRHEEFGGPRDGLANVALNPLPVSQE